MSKGLKKVLKKVFASDVQEQLAVADAKLGSVIKVRLCSSPSSVCGGGGLFGVKCCSHRYTSVG